MLLLVTAYAEEIGWRGFAAAQLRRSHGVLGTGLIVEVFWALWHLPSMFVIENYRELGLAILPGFLLGILAGSIFLTWLCNRCGSISIVALWHTTYNLFSGMAAAHGLIAAMVSTAVIAAALVIVVRELMRRWTGIHEAREDARSKTLTPRHTIHKRKRHPDRDGTRWRRAAVDRLARQQPRCRPCRRGPRRAIPVHAAVAARFAVSVYVGRGRMLTALCSWFVRSVGIAGMYEIEAS